MLYEKFNCLFVELSDDTNKPRLLNLVSPPSCITVAAAAPASDVTSVMFEDTLFYVMDLLPEQWLVDVI